MIALLTGYTFFKNRLTDRFFYGVMLSLSFIKRLQFVFFRAFMFVYLLVND